MNAERMTSWGEEVTWPTRTHVVTFLAINDEVPLFVPCRDRIDYTISIRVFGQDSCDQGVGACVLRDECPVSAEKL